MADEWELINRALGAEAQGRSLAPQVSRRTLFGIKSDVEEKMERIAAEVASASAGGTGPHRALGRLSALAGRFPESLLIGRADRYYLFRARSAGYDIPAYPFSRSGELSAFLADEGVPDLPSWYEAAGVPARLAGNLAGYGLVAFRDGGGSWHEALVAHAAPYLDASRFTPLSDAPFLDLAPEDVADEILNAALEVVKAT